MVIQKVEDEDYSVYYEPGSTTVYFKGDLSLSGPPEYAPISQLLKEAIAPTPPTITLDLTQLEFLNSSGINMISKFVIGLRQKPDVQAVVIGSKEIPWQGKSLKNLVKLLPGLHLELR